MSVCCCNPFRKPKDVYFRSYFYYDDIKNIYIGYLNAFNGLMNDGISKIYYDSKADKLLKSMRNAVIGYYGDNANLVYIFMTSKSFYRRFGHLVERFFKYDYNGEIK